MPLRSAFFINAFSIFTIAACSQSVGNVCDPEKARNVAYNRQGLPAYEGQALLIQSCANGQQCHSEAIGRSTVRRFGAPAAMNFDAILVEQYLNAMNSAPPPTPDPSEADAMIADAIVADAMISTADSGMMVLTPEQDAQQRLRRIQNAIYQHRDAIYATVVEGSMPPRNFTEDPKSYRRADDSAVPPVNGTQGREILRNWLACGAPVVERTVAPPPVRCDNRSACVVTRDCDTTMHVCRAVGDTIPRRTGGSIEPKFSSIYGNIFGTSTCASSTCHGSGSLLPDFRTQSQAYTTLTMNLGGQTCVGGNARVVPNNPNQSVLLERISGTTCGSETGRTRMGSLEESQIEVIREWIASGARND